MGSETLIRLSIFLGLFALFALAEMIAPRRHRIYTRGKRWWTNISVSVLDSLCLGILALAIPLLAFGAALDAAENGWGILNWLSLPGAFKIVLSVVFLDFAIWFQHFLSHKIPLLWRFHRVHHSDRDVDVTTALRFHPVEILLSMIYKVSLVYLIGVPPAGVVLFEILLNGTAMFNHANLKLTPRLEVILRSVLVTPDMHRIHHSVKRSEHDSNYGFALSCWDRFLGTYRAKPERGHETMDLGLDWQDDRPTRLSWILRLPFTKRP